ncbi:MAG TPA: LamG-like jellyroll fold domain-containing protein, partial [Candidatus Nitrosopolaris sp.]|nr:LamG-like jellyroll fold domain-containing protein [Candidatus Nitrosopolaris sp.]
TYQWFVNGTSMGAGGTNATLTLNNVHSGQAGTYWVVVSNSLGSITSQPAVISVGNLVALWRFNEGSGTTVHDSSGLGNNGTLMGTDGKLPGWVGGMPGFGDALSFTNDGTDYTYVSVPGSASLVIGQTATNPWTITAWAYESSDGTGNFAATYGRILVIDDGTELQLESGASGDGEFFTWDRQSGLWEIGWGAGNSVSPLLDQWEHWAVVYDGTNITLYRDGNQGPSGGVASQPVNAYLDYGSPDQGAILIGSELDQSANRNWNGTLDDVAIFNVALSQAQIRTVMAGDFSAFVMQPQLSISRRAGDVILSWPAAQATFQLQSATGLTPVSWTNVATNTVQNGSTLTVTLPVGPGTQFFRLIGP